MNGTAAVADLNIILRDFNRFFVLRRSSGVLLRVSVAPAKPRR